MARGPILLAIFEAPRQHRAGSRARNLVRPGKARPAWLPRAGPDQACSACIRLASELHERVQRLEALGQVRIRPVLGAKCAQELVGGAPEQALGDEVLGALGVELGRRGSAKLVERARAGCAPFTFAFEAHEA